MATSRTTISFARTFVALAAFVAISCDKGKQGESDQDKPETKAPLAQAEAKAEPAAVEAKAEPPGEKNGANEPDVAGQAAGAEDLNVGVAECDEYVTKYMKCIEDKLPDTAKEPTRKAVAQTIKSWQKMGEGSDKDKLVEICKKSLESTKQATQAVGCEW